MLFAFQTFAFCERASLLKESRAAGQNRNEKKLKNGILPAAKPIKCRFFSYLWAYCFTPWQSRPGPGPGRYTDDNTAPSWPAALHDCRIPAPAYCRYTESGHSF